MAKATELFEEQSKDLEILIHLKTRHADGSIVSWAEVDVAVHEANILKEKVRAIMARRDKEIEAVNNRYSETITRLQDVKDSIDGLVEGFCDVHATELRFEAHGDHEEIATKKLQNCSLTIIKESKTRIKVSHDKPAPKAA